MYRAVTVLLGGWLSLQTAYAKDGQDLITARTKMLAGDLVSATQISQAVATQGGPEAKLASYLLGQLYYQDHEFDLAAEAFSHAEGLGISSYAHFYRAESLFWSHDAVAAKHAFEVIVATDKDSPFMPWARLRIADADFAVGEYEAASREYKAFLRDFPAYSYPEAIAFSLAECARRTGNTTGAADAYLSLWINEPHTIHAARSFDARQQMVEEGAKITAPSFLQRLARASNLRQQRFHAQALEELDALRKEVLATSFSGDAALVASIDIERGICLLRLGKPAEAATLLAPLAKNSKSALRYLADAQSMSGATEDAVKSYETYADITDQNRKKQKSRAYADFLFDIGQYKEARVEYSKLGKDSDITFRLAWCDYRQDNFAAATKALEAISKKGGEYQGTAVYWLARIQEKQGKEKEAIAAYHAIIDDDDTSYYAVLSRSRLALQGEIPAAPLGPSDVSDTSHIKDIRPKAIDVDNAFQDVLANNESPSLERAYEFYQLGLEGNGREELEAGYFEAKSGKGAAFQSRSPYFPANWKRKGKTAEELILADTAPGLSKDGAAIQETNAASTAALNLNPEEGAQLKEGNSSALVKTAKLAKPKPVARTADTFWKDIGVAFAGLGDAHYPMYLAPVSGGKRYYPQAYPEVVVPIAQEFNHAPEELWSLMHTESLFHRFVASYVGAIGLMQIMPKTGRAIGPRLGNDDFRPGTLFDASTNLYFAGWYYRQLKEVFHNQLPLAMAAYNGGPYMVGRIIRAKAHTNPELDELIEEIPPRQSRLYAKKVMHKVSLYQKLYKGSTGLTIDLTLNTDVGDQVDF